MRRTARISALWLAALAHCALAAAADGIACGCGDGGGHGGPVRPPGPEYLINAGCYEPLECAEPHPIYLSPRGTWYVETEVVAFLRDVEGLDPYAALNTPDNIVLDTSDLEIEHQGGLRVLIGRQLSKEWAFEGSYWGLMTWDEMQSVRDLTPNAQGTVGNLFSPFTDFGNPAQVGLDFNNFVSISLESTVQNVELNLRQRLKTPPSMMQASVLYGFRYMQVDEDFGYLSQSFAPAPTGTQNEVNISTVNDLYGFQIGGRLEFRVEKRAWIEFEAKAALCHNEAGQQTEYTVGPLAGPGATTIGERFEDRRAAIGDIALSVLCQFTPRLVGRIGYQAVWVDGLALASENFEQNVAILTAGPADLKHNGTIVYHGPFVGLTTTW